MSLYPIIGFAVVAILALGFALWPLHAGAKKRTWLLAAAVALFMLGVGGGVYWMVGRPHLAQRAAQGLNTREVNGLVPFLIQEVRKHPKDAKAWRYLAQAYMSANDPNDAAKALAQVIALTGKGDPELLSAYGEALTLANSGGVPEDAERAFIDALRVDPSSARARFYLGLARAQHNDRPAAIQYWESLLADVPPNAPIHQVLVDRLAMLRSQTPGGAPNPKAMVEMLAARLKADPNDALGWVRLMRAYTVLGETDKAKEALATARKTFKDNADAQTAFKTAAKALKLE